EAAMNPELAAPRSLAEYHPFVFRSRERLYQNIDYDLERWRSNSKSLRATPGGKLLLHPVEESADLVSFAKIDGLLVIRAALDGMASPAMKLLRGALESGLPFVCW